MIASTKGVRDAKKIGGKGAEKFLDEMLVFRTCPAPRAIQQMQNHGITFLYGPENLGVKDSLTVIFPNCKLKKATRDRIWDAAQGLVRHGVMHNNVRMTWELAIADCHADPEEAMALALELNNPALDGKDANSIAGIHWCFGLFDRPFDPRPYNGSNSKEANI